MTGNGFFGDHGSVSWTAVVITVWLCAWALGRALAGR